VKPIYGPVPSWRLGKSLGVDPVCSSEKICSFDCEYCQLGKTVCKTTKRKSFVSKFKVRTELRKALKLTDPDVITFSGTSEPTLALNLGELIQAVKNETSKPVAVLTNSSLFTNKKVRKELVSTNHLIAKLDAHSQKLFMKINEPAEEITFEETLKGIKRMRKEFKGEKFSLQCMFYEKNMAFAKEIAEIARGLKPDEIQIDTPIRPCAVKPLNRVEIGKINEKFAGMKTISVYTKKKPVVKAIDSAETRTRRPAEGLN